MNIELGDSVGGRSRRCIIVSGLPRSGTSWVAKALSFAPGFTYYREPDNYDHVKGTHKYFDYLYLPVGRDDLAYHQHMTRVLNGQIATPFTMKEDPGPLLGRLPQAWSRCLGSRLPFLYFRKSNLLIKLVRSNLALEWLSEYYPDAMQVHVLRHPCGLFASWRRNNWERDPKRLLEDDVLVRDHLSPHVTTIRHARTFWEKAGALWGATYVVIERQLAAHPNWLLVQHEWLCQDPVAHFRALYSALDLTWNERVEVSIKSLNRPATDKNPYSLTRLASEEIDKWKRQLTPNEIAECKCFVEKFGVGYYPGFEPIGAIPNWLK